MYIAIANGWRGIIQNDYKKYSAADIVHSAIAVNRYIILRSRRFVKYYFQSYTKIRRQSIAKSHIDIFTKVSQSSTDNFGEFYNALFLFCANTRNEFFVDMCKYAKKRIVISA